ncbi:MULTISPECIES: hypothetical protein [Niastella]|uniref:Uncharacterized protein n=1 Tax=Niastella soli TaxID=2821487 RepID=A0ABS3YZB0_9BACT|nr:hypothetical protein [Niastella soli]MBO9203269.1 hypothetical protein [Niastella soli]
MRPDSNKSTELVRVSKAGLLALVARQIMGRDLFPKRTAEAKRIIERMRFVKKIEQ